MLGMKNITVPKIMKTLAVGTGVCTVALVAPLGVPTVVVITAVAAGASWAVDSVSDELKKGK